MLEITLNGEAHEVAPNSSVADLLAGLGLRSEQVAVEYNREVLPRAEHAGQQLRAGDNLEVVTFVGGG